MNNFDVMKKIIPLLRKDEEIVSIPPKGKLNFIFHIFIFIFLFIILAWYSYGFVFDFSIDMLFMPFMCLCALLFMSISSIIAFLTNLMVITNQRLICFRYGQMKSFERDNIEKITHSYMEDRYCIQNVLIKTKDSVLYTIEYYDSKTICEILGFIN